MSRLSVVRWLVVALVFGMWFVSPVARAQSGLFEMVPTRASGIEGADWILGPGPNEITLAAGDQSVEFDMYMSGWGPLGTDGYEAVLDCSLFDSGTQGTLVPLLVDCYEEPDAPFCHRIDVSRPDWVFAGSHGALGTGPIFYLCADGSPGKVRLGCFILVNLDGWRPDDGGTYYAATFVTDVSPDALGTFTFGLDPDPDSTWIGLEDYSWLNPALLPGLITVLGSGGPCTAPGRPMPDDRFGITAAATDTARTCTTQSDCVVGLSPDSDVTCIDPPTGEAGPGVCYVPTNRYLSIDPNPANAGMRTARRISLDLGGGETQVLGWVGEPVSTPVPGPEPSPQLLSHIEPEPHYVDWTQFDSVHVGDCETSPGHTYLIEEIQPLADRDNPACYSEALALSTVSYYGDVTGGAEGTPPDRVRNFHDILATVRGFQHVQTAPRAWLDLSGSGEVPEVPFFGLVNLLDISAAAAGFQGASYPYATPCDCPGQACP